MRWLASSALLALVLLLGGCRVESAAAAEGGDAATTGLWRPLVAAGARWKLINYNIRAEPNRDDAVVVTNHDLRQVGEAAVARLSWKTIAGEDVGSGEHLPQQVAVSGDKVWFLPLHADDAAVAQALTRKPTFVDPPADVRPTRKNRWRWVNTSSGKHGRITCIGHYRRDDDCEDTCTGMVCFSAIYGVVAVEGTSSPNFEHYALEGHQDD